MTEWLWAPGGGDGLRPVATLLREYRAEHRMPQAQLAELLGFTQSYVSKVEGGARQVDDVGTLRLISERLDIPAEDLGLARDEQPTSGPLPTAVVSGQRAWKTARRGLNHRRIELSRAAAELYAPGDRFGSLLARPGWLLDAPVDLADVALRWAPAAPPPAVTGSEPPSRHVMPPAAGGRPYARYSRAVRDLDRPALFENRLSYRLLEVDAGDRPVLTFGHTTYFDAFDVCEAAAHETAAAAAAGPLRWADLPFRQLLGDPFDPRQRPLLPSINTLTIRAGSSPAFVLHRRNSGSVAVAGDCYHVMPAGVFQPAGISPASSAHDFDLWRNVMREFSEEFLGNPEHDGESSELTAYDEEPFRSLDAARRDGTLQVWYLGLGLDALTLYGEVLTVAVVDERTFDRLFDGIVPVNAEGSVVLARQDGRPAEGLLFSAACVSRLLADEPLAPAAAAILELAWRHRGQLLDGLAG